MIFVDVGMKVIPLQSECSTYNSFQLLTDVLAFPGVQNLLLEMFSCEIGQAVLICNPSFFFHLTNRQIYWLGAGIHFVPWFSS